MDWQGRISGSDKVWGAAAATTVIAVDGDRSAPEAVPGKLLPDDPMMTDTGMMLPALGDLTGRERLALVGFLSLNPHWDGVAVVVGADATKWATLSAGEIIHCQGSATPRIAAGLGLDGVAPTGMDDALDRPERLPLLLHAAASKDQRLGVLLGAEIGATRTLWLGQQCVLVGDGPLGKGYARALQAAHVPVTLTDTQALIQKGFEAIAAKHFQPD